MSLRAAELGERGLDLFISCEAAFSRRPQAAVNAGKFRFGRLVVALAQTFLNIARDLGKLVLRMRGPVFHPLKNFGELLGFHESILARSSD
jgi:hypothetical protein